MSVKNIDNQIDHVIDRQVDRPVQTFTEITRRSRVFSIPYMGPPIYEPLPTNGLPNIEVATTEVVQVSDYPLLNGIYTKGFDPNIEIYFIRDDGEYYFWDAESSGAGGNAFWRFESLITSDLIAESPWINDQDLLIPSENWVLTNGSPIPLKITVLG